MHYSVREMVLAILVVGLSLALGGTWLFLWKPEPQRYAAEVFTVIPAQGIALLEGEDPVVQKAYPGVQDILLEGQILFSGPLNDHFIQIHYPQGLGTAIDEELYHWATSEFGRSAASHAHFFGEAAKAEGLNRLAAADYWKYKRNYPQVTTYSLTETGAGYSTVLFRSWCYGGGAREYITNTAFSFNKATGERVSLETLFPGKSIFSLAGWLTAHMEQLVEQASTGQMEDFELQELVFSVNDINLDQVVLMPNGLALFFPPARLAAYSRDVMSAFVPLEELAGLGVNTQFWGTP